jgi:predicted GIY-YIG superfamily endonuclease
VGVVYLLCLERPVGRARHYLGSTTDLVRRVAQHRAGRGGTLPAIAARLGIAFAVARQWPGGVREEQRIRRRGDYRRLCPLCAQRDGRPVREELT